MMLDPAARTVQLLKPGHEARRRRDRQGLRRPGGARRAQDRAGSRRALVGGAGDIVVGDPPPDAAGWTIAIAPLDPPARRPPADPAPDERGGLDRRRRRAVRRDRRPSLFAHHQPATGLGLEDRASVTVVAPDGATADALETTVYILGPERGLKLVDETPGAAAIFRALDARRDQDLRIVAVPPGAEGRGQGCDGRRGGQPP